MNSRVRDEKLWRYLGGQPPSAEFSRLISSDPAVAYRLAELALIECAIREEATAKTGRQILRRQRLFVVGGVGAFFAVLFGSLIAWKMARDELALGTPIVIAGDSDAEEINAEVRQGKVVRVPNRPLRMAFVGEDTNLVFDPDSEVRFEESPQGGRLFELSSGRLKAEVSSQNAPFRVKTPHLSVEVLGTAFAVSVSGGASEVMVDEGTVAVNSKSLDEPLRLSSGSGWKQSEEGRGFSMARAAYTGTAPVIDRNNDPLWSSQPAMMTHFHEADRKSENDHSSSWKAVWNDEALFVLIEVVDSEADNSHAKVWANDSVEIFIDADNSRNAKFDGINDHFLFFEPGREAIIPGVGALDPKAGMVHQSHRTSGGFRVEVRLPWEALGIEPGAGLQLGFNVASNDSDTGDDERSQLSWTPKSGNDWSRPDRMGSLILTGPEPE